MIESSFAQECLERLMSVTSRAMDEQKSFLLRILEKNKDTFFGKKYDFSSIHSISDFQERLPFTEFDDYEKLIDREVAGERGIFTAAPPYFYCLSSGSLGEPKYFPLVKEDAILQHIYWDGAIRGIIRRDLSQFTEEELFGNIFLMSDVFLTNMPNGAISGVRSAVASRMQYEEGTYPYELFYAPKEVLFPEKIVDIQYVKFRFALENQDITAIHANFVHKAIASFRYLIEHFEQILFDMERGEVNSELCPDEKWASFLKKKLPPNPKRAEELRVFSGSELSKGLIQKIWPKIKYLRLSSGMQFYPFVEQIDYYSGGLPVYPFLYAATEGMFGVAQGVGKLDAYILIPDICFFEFLPEQDERQQALTLSQVKLGERYELIITTLSGLYRYRLGDVVEVVDFENDSPVISINYRKGQILNLADEKMNSVQFDNAIGMFFGEREFWKAEYCVAGNCQKVPPCYSIFIESNESLPEKANRIMDEALQKSCPNYKKAREENKLGEAEILRLPLGSFTEFWKLRGKGRRSEQTKPLKILTNKNDIVYFEQMNKRAQ